MATTLPINVELRLRSDLSTTTYPSYLNKTIQVDCNIKTQVLEELRKAAPCLDFINNDTTINKHRLSATIRSASRAIIDMDMERYDIKNLIVMGPSIAYQIKNPRDIHCCIPLCDQDDPTRITEQLSQVSRIVSELDDRNTGDFNNEIIFRAKQLNNMAGEQPFCCPNKFEDCNYKADALVSVQSNLNTSPETVISSMLTKGIQVGYFAFHTAGAIGLGASNDIDRFTGMKVGLFTNGELYDSRIINNGAITSDNVQINMYEKLKCWLFDRDIDLERLRLATRRCALTSPPIPDGNHEITSSLVAPFWDPLVRRKCQNKLFEFELLKNQKIIFYFDGRIHIHDAANVLKWQRLAQEIPIRTLHGNYVCHTEVLWDFRLTRVLKLTIAKAQSPPKKSFLTYDRINADEVIILQRVNENTYGDKRRKTRCIVRSCRMTTTTFTRVMGILNSKEEGNKTAAVRAINAVINRISVLFTDIKTGESLTAIEIDQLVDALMLYRSNSSEFFKDVVIYTPDQTINCRNPLEFVDMTGNCTSMLPGLNRSIAVAEVVNQARDCESKRTIKPNFVHGKPPGPAYSVDPNADKFDPELIFHSMQFYGLEYATCTSTQISAYHEISGSHFLTIYICDSFDERKHSVLFDTKNPETATAKLYIYADKTILSLGYDRYDIRDFRYTLGKKSLRMKLGRHNIKTRDLRLYHEAIRRGCHINSIFKDAAALACLINMRRGLNEKSLDVYDRFAKFKDLTNMTTCYCIINFRNVDKIRVTTVTNDSTFSHKDMFPTRVNDFIRIANGVDIGVTNKQYKKMRKLNKNSPFYHEDKTTLVHKSYDKTEYNKFSVINYGESFTLIEKNKFVLHTYADIGEIDGRRVVNIGGKIYKTPTDAFLKSVKTYHDYDLPHHADLFDFTEKENNAVITEYHELILVRHNSRIIAMTGMEINFYDSIFYQIKYSGEDKKDIIRCHLGHKNLEIDVNEEFGDLPRTTVGNKTYINEYDLPFYENGVDLGDVPFAGKIFYMIKSTLCYRDATAHAVEVNDLKFMTFMGIPVDDEPRIQHYFRNYHLINKITFEPSAPPATIYTDTTADPNMRDANLDNDNRRLLNQDQEIPKDITVFDTTELPVVNRLFHQFDEFEIALPTDQPKVICLEWRNYLPINNIAIIEQARPVTKAISDDYVCDITITLGESRQFLYNNSLHLEIPHINRYEIERVLDQHDHKHVRVQYDGEINTSCTLHSDVLIVLNDDLITLTSAITPPPAYDTIDNNPFSAANFITDGVAEINMNEVFVNKYSRNHNYNESASAASCTISHDSASTISSAAQSQPELYYVNPNYTESSCHSNKESASAITRTTLNDSASSVCTTNSDAIFDRRCNEWILEVTKRLRSQSFDSLSTQFHATKRRHSLDSSTDEFLNSKTYKRSNEYTNEQYKEDLDKLFISEGLTRHSATAIDKATDELKHLLKDVRTTFEQDSEQNSDSSTNESLDMDTIKEMVATETKTFKNACTNHTSREYDNIIDGSANRKTFSSNDENIRDFDHYLDNVSFNQKMHKMIDERNVKACQEQADELFGPSNSTSTVTGHDHEATTTMSAVSDDNIIPEITVEIDQVAATQIRLDFEKLAVTNPYISEQRDYSVSLRYKLGLPENDTANPLCRNSVLYNGFYNHKTIQDLIKTKSTRSVVINDFTEPIDLTVVIGKTFSLYQGTLTINKPDEINVGLRLTAGNHLRLRCGVQNSKLCAIINHYSFNVVSCDTFVGSFALPIQLGRTNVYANNNNDVAIGLSMRGDVEQQFVDYNGQFNYANKTHSFRSSLSQYYNNTQVKVFDIVRRLKRDTFECTAELRKTLFTDIHTPKLIFANQQGIGITAWPACNECSFRDDNHQFCKNCISVNEMMAEQGYVCIGYSHYRSTDVSTITKGDANAFVKKIGYVLVLNDTTHSLQKFVDGKAYKVSMKNRQAKFTTSKSCLKYLDRMTIKPTIGGGLSPISAQAIIHVSEDGDCTDENVEVSCRSSNNITAIPNLHDDKTTTMRIGGKILTLSQDKTKKKKFSHTIIIGDDLYVSNVARSSLNNVQYEDLKAGHAITDTKFGSALMSTKCEFNGILKCLDDCYVRGYESHIYASIDMDDFDTLLLAIRESRVAIFTILLRNYKENKGEYDAYTINGGVSCNTTDITWHNRSTYPSTNTHVENVIKNFTCTDADAKCSAVFGISFTDILFPYFETKGDWPDEELASVVEYMTTVRYDRVSIEAACSFYDQHVAHLAQLGCKGELTNVNGVAVTWSSRPVAYEKHDYAFNRKTKTIESTKKYTGNEKVILIPELAHYFPYLIDNGLNNLPLYSYFKNRTCAVEGPPGTGKTYVIVKSYTPSDAVLVPSKRSVDDLSVKSQSFTSVIINGNKIKNPLRLLIDEYGMLHKGLFLILQQIYQPQACTILFGDKNQIGYISFGLNACLYSVIKPKLWTSMHITKRLSVQNTTILGCVYDNHRNRFLTCNGTAPDNIFEYNSDPPAEIDHQGKKLLVTISQMNKQTLLAARIRGIKNTEIHTAHEIQGMSVGYVMFYNPKDIDSSLYKVNPVSPHLLVSMSRSSKITVYRGVEGKISRFLSTKADLSRLVPTTQFETMHENVQSFVSRFTYDAIPGTGEVYNEDIDSFNPLSFTPGLIVGPPADDLKGLNISDKCLQMIANYSVDKIVETGGFLYGDQENIVAVTKSSFNCDAKHCDLVLTDADDALLAEHEFTGTWHSHTNGLLLPSNEDDLTMFNQSLNHGKPLISVIYNIANNSYNCYMYSPTHRTLLDIKIVNTPTSNTTTLVTDNSCWIDVTLQIFEYFGITVLREQFDMWFCDQIGMTGNVQLTLERLSRKKFGMNIFDFGGEGCTYTIQPNHYVFGSAEGEIQKVGLAKIECFHDALNKARAKLGPNIRKMSNLHKKYESLSDLLGKFVDLTPAPGVFASKSKCVMSVFHKFDGCLEMLYTQADKTCHNSLLHCDCLDTYKENVISLDIATNGTGSAIDQYNTNKNLFECVIARLLRNKTKFVVKSFYSPQLIKFLYDKPKLFIIRIDGSSPAGQEVYVTNLVMQSTMNIDKHYYGSLGHLFANSYNGINTENDFQVVMPSGSDLCNVSGLSYDSADSLLLAHKFSHFDIVSTVFCKNISACVNQADYSLSEQIVQLCINTRKHYLNVVHLSSVAGSHCGTVDHSSSPDTLNTTVNTIHPSCGFVQGFLYLCAKANYSGILDDFIAILITTARTDSDALTICSQINNVKLDGNTTVTTFQGNDIRIYERKRGLKHADINGNKLTEVTVQYLHNRGITIGESYGSFFFSSDPGSVRYQPSPHSHNDYDVCYYKDVLPDNIILCDEKEKIMATIKDYYELGVESPRFVTYKSYPKVPDIIISKYKKTDAVCALQICRQAVELIAPGASTYDCSMDACINNSGDIEFQTNHIKFDVSKAGEPEKPHDGFQPALSTGSAPTQKVTVRTIANALNKRNFNPPKIACTMDYRATAAFVLKNYLEHACVSNVWEFIEAFCDDPIEPTVDKVKMWISKQPMDKLGICVRDITENQYLECSRELFTQLSFSMKTKHKTATDNTNIVGVQKAQTTRYESKLIVAAYSGCVAEMSRRLHIIEKPHIIDPSGRNSPNIEAAITSVLNESYAQNLIEVMVKNPDYSLDDCLSHASLKQEEQDFSKFDKSHAATAYYFKYSLCKITGMRFDICENFLNMYRYTKNRCKELRIKLDIQGQHPSGSINTLRGNTDVSKGAILSTATDKTYHTVNYAKTLRGLSKHSDKNPNNHDIFESSLDKSTGQFVGSAITFMASLGDDGSTTRDEAKHCDKYIADRMNLEVVTKRDGVQNFCGSFFIQDDQDIIRLVRDPIKVLCKLGQESVTANTNLRQQWYSVKESIHNWNNDRVRLILCDYVSRKYKQLVDYPIDNLITAIQTLVDTFENYSRLYYATSESKRLHRVKGGREFDDVDWRFFTEESLVPVPSIKSVAIMSRFCYSINGGRMRCSDSVTITSDNKVVVGKDEVSYETLTLSIECPKTRNNDNERKTQRNQQQNQQQQTKENKERKTLRNQTDENNTNVKATNDKKFKDNNGKPYSKMRPYEKTTVKFATDEVSYNGTVCFIDDEQVLLLAHHCPPPVVDGVELSLHKSYNYIDSYLYKKKRNEVPKILRMTNEPFDVVITGKPMVTSTGEFPVEKGDSGGSIQQKFEGRTYIVGVITHSRGGNGVYSYWNGENFIDEHEEGDVQVSKLLILANNEHVLSYKENVLEWCPLSSKSNYVCKRCRDVCACVINGRCLQCRTYDVPKGFKHFGCKNCTTSTSALVLHHNPKAPVIGKMFPVVNYGEGYAEIGFDSDKKELVFKNVEQESHMTFCNKVEPKFFLIHELGKYRTLVRDGYVFQLEDGLAKFVGFREGGVVYTIDGEYSDISARGTLVKYRGAILFATAAHVCVTDHPLVGRVRHRLGRINLYQWNGDDVKAYDISFTNNKNIMIGSELMRPDEFHSVPGDSGTPVFTSVKGTVVFCGVVDGLLHDRTNYSILGQTHHVSEHEHSLGGAIALLVLFANVADSSYCAGSDQQKNCFDCSAAILNRGGDCRYTHSFCFKNNKAVYTTNKKCISSITPKRIRVECDDKSCHYIAVGEKRYFNNSPYTFLAGCILSAIIYAATICCITTRRQRRVPFHSLTELSIITLLVLCTTTNSQIITSDTNFDEHNNTFDVTWDCHIATDACLQQLKVSEMCTQQCTYLHTRCNDVRRRSKVMNCAGNVFTVSDCAVHMTKPDYAWELVNCGQSDYKRKDDDFITSQLDIGILIGSCITAASFISIIMMTLLICGRKPAIFITILSWFGLTSASMTTSVGTVAGTSIELLLTLVSAIVIVSAIFLVFGKIMTLVFVISLIAPLTSCKLTKHNIIKNSAGGVESGHMDLAIDFHLACIPTLVSIHAEFGKTSNSKSVLILSGTVVSKCGAAGGSVFFNKTKPIAYRSNSQWWQWLCLSFDFGANSTASGYGEQKDNWIFAKSTESLAYSAFPRTGSQRGIALICNSFVQIDYDKYEVKVTMLKVLSHQVDQIDTKSMIIVFNNAICGYGSNTTDVLFTACFKIRLKAYEGKKNVKVIVQSGVVNVLTIITESWCNVSHIIIEYNDRKHNLTITNGCMNMWIDRTYHHLRAGCKHNCTSIYTYNQGKKSKYWMMCSMNASTEFTYKPVMLPNNRMLLASGTGIYIGVDGYNYTGITGRCRPIDRQNKASKYFKSISCDDNIVTNSSICVAHIQIDVPIDLVNDEYELVPVKYKFNVDSGNLHIVSEMVRYSINNITKTCYDDCEIEIKQGYNYTVGDSVKMRYDVNENQCSQNPHKNWAGYFGLFLCKNFTIYVVVSITFTVISVLYCIYKRISKRYYGISEAIVKIKKKSSGFRPKFRKESILPHIIYVLTFMSRIQPGLCSEWVESVNYGISLVFVLVVVFVCLKFLDLLVLLMKNRTLLEKSAVIITIIFSMIAAVAGDQTIIGDYKINSDGEVYMPKATLIGHLPLDVSAHSQRFSVSHEIKGRYTKPLTASVKVVKVESQVTNYVDAWTSDYKVLTHHGTHCYNTVDDYAYPTAGSFRFNNPAATFTQFWKTDTGGGCFFAWQKRMWWSAKSTRTSSPATYATLHKLKVSGLKISLNVTIGTKTYLFTGSANGESFSTNNVFNATFSSASTLYNPFPEHTVCYRGKLYSRSYPAHGAGKSTQFGTTQSRDFKKGSDFTVPMDIIESTTINFDYVEPTHGFKVFKDGPKDLLQDQANAGCQFIVTGSFPCSIKLHSCGVGTIPYTITFSNVQLQSNIRYPVIKLISDEQIGDCEFQTSHYCVIKLVIRCNDDYVCPIITTTAIKETNIALHNGINTVSIHVLAQKYYDRAIIQVCNTEFRINYVSKAPEKDVIINNTAHDHKLPSSGGFSWFRLPDFLSFLDGLDFGFAKYLIYAAIFAIIGYGIYRLIKRARSKVKKT